MLGATKRIALETIGWLLVLAGIAALVLPGPGLLMIFGGMAILSEQYDWAERRLAPIKYRALKGAAESVETWPRILMSSTLAVGLMACGVLWIVRPDMPSWWPFDERWWLPGGEVTGITQIVSGIVAMVLIVYSYRRFHGKPEAVAELEDEIREADAGFRSLHDD
ncbi:PGPGW domain-containing protein [Nocardioides alcanivorans]|uniref:PGPGW domain-containing protein n=1 Tax=Nocardioides alcanivorans TaxID=2897352 RepID=UPI001F1671EF|nr:PGPGW domain-containing protein [Nocardioides alcanivorans]